MGLIPYVCDDWFKTIIKGQNEAAILKFLGGTSEKLGQNQLAYKKAQADFVQQNNVQFLDPWELFSGHKELMCYDGIHIRSNLNIEIHKLRIAVGQNGMRWLKRKEQGTASDKRLNVSVEMARNMRCQRWKQLRFASRPFQNWPHFDLGLKFVHFSSVRPEHFGRNSHFALHSRRRGHLIHT